MSFDVEYRGLIRSSKLLSYITCLIFPLLTLSTYAESDIEDLKARFVNSHNLEKAKLAAEIASSLRQSDADQALQYAQLALEQIKTTAHNPTEVNVINTLAIVYLQKREYDSTTHYAEQALELAKGLKLPLEEAKALNTLGALSWYRGNLDEAKNLFSESLTIRKQQNDFGELSPILNNLGVIEEIQGRYNTAIEYYLQAIRYAEQAGSDEQLARPISNLGVLHQMLQNFDKALVYYKKSLELKLKVNNLVGAALAHNNISEIQIEDGQYEAALESLESGLNLLKKIDAPQEKALLQVNMGSAFLELKRPEKAFEYFNQTKNQVSLFNSNEIDIYLAQGYARAFLQKDQLDKALSYAQEYLILGQAKQDSNALKKAQHLHYQIYKKKGLYAQALAAHENFNRIQEELNSKKNTEYVARLQAEFDAEKNEKKLALLQRKNALQEIDIRRQQFFRNLSAILSLFGLVIGIFAYHLRTTKTKAALLEKKVEERTNEIQQRNSTIAELLRQKENLLERKNILFSTVSHEFRTPLTLILGPLKRLSGETKNKETRLTMNNIYRNAMRLLRMVDQLLDLARIDMRADRESEAVDVESVLRFLLTSMESLFQENNISSNIQLEEGVCINISQDALEKVCVNLLSNAVKYSPQGGEITITAKTKEDTAFISISDHGLGIEKHEQEKIFERFTRLDSPSNKPVPGAGIGLALVKELVEHYNGKIKVISEVNKGSTFTLIFPKSNLATKSTKSQLCSTACETELAVLESADASVLSVVESVSEKLRTVLIVEDNDEMRSYIGNILNKHYNCLYAEDGREGVNLAINEIPDLIISDLMMPHINGLELAVILREDQLTSHIPIIVLTAKGDPETRYAAWQKHVDEYIGKPFDADELILRCENILSIRQLVGEHYSLKTTTKKGVGSAKINDVAHSGFSQRDRDFLDKLGKYLVNNFYESELNAKKISAALAVTEKQLQRKVKALTNDTIPAYVRNFRLKKGAELLSEGASITSVAFDVGFSSQSYFSTAFAARYGCSPSDYQNQKRKLSGSAVPGVKIIEADASVGF